MLLFTCPNPKSSSQFSEGSKRVLNQPTIVKQGIKHTQSMSFMMDGYSSGAIHVVVGAAG